MKDVTPQNRKKGVVLVIVISVMVSMAIMGVSFVRISTSENAATGNYSTYVEAELTALAGIERAIIEIQNQLRNTGAIDWRGAIRYQSNLSDLEDATNPNATEQIISFDAGNVFGYSYSGQVGMRNPADLSQILGRYDVGGNFYSLKIEESAGKLNVNSHISAINQTRSNSIMNQLLRTLASNCGLGANATNAANKLRSANANTPYRFRNMHEVREALDSPRTPPYPPVVNPQNLPAIPNGAAKELFLQNLCTDSWVDTKTVGAQKTSPHNTTPGFYSEQRAPVNVNQVSQELLSTLIRHIKATTLFYNVDPEYGNDQVGTGPQFQTETNMQIQPEYRSISFSDTEATNIARHIIQGAPFNDRGTLESRIDNIPPGQLPNNPDPSWIGNEYWRKACRDTLKSNFNPDLIDNHLNPNSEIYLRVGKGDLYDLNTFQACHTTELCLFSFGDITISSLARITAGNGSRVISKCLITAKVRFAELLTHTTQQDFSSGTFTNTTSYPTVVGRTGADPDSFAGGVQPSPRRVVGASQLDPYYPDFTSASYFPSAYAGNAAFRMTLETLRSIGINNLTHDGIVSRRGYYELPAHTRYFAVNAISYGADLRDHTPPVPVGKVGNCQGTIAFWVKLSEEPIGDNGTSGMPCGLLGVTTVSQVLNAPIIDRSNYTTRNPREGMQIFMYINTLGELRISRLYYAMYWDSSISKWRGLLSSNQGDTAYRKFPRRDAVIDNIGSGGKQWNAHEWHHVCISWDDTRTDNDHFRVWLDHHLEVEGGDCEISTSELDGEYCVLNESDPKDVLYINGFFRNQPRAGGYFPFGTIIDYLGNATVDSFISYRAANAWNTTGIPKRYVDAPSYSNSFTIPNPTDPNPLPRGPFILGRLRSSSYPAQAVSPNVVCDLNGIAVGTLVNNGQNISYNANFSTSESISGDVLRLRTASLESVNLEVYYLYPRFISIEYR